MNNRTQIRWHCTNHYCRKETLMDSGSEPDGVKPLCSCGSPMKKSYAPPVLRYLDFLYPEETELAPKTRREG